MNLCLDSGERFPDCLGIKVSARNGLIGGVWTLVVSLAFSDSSAKFC